MSQMREIGHHLQAEQNLTSEDIAWLVGIAKAILRAFVWDEGQPMRTLADTLGISPTTLYTTLRLAVQALMWVRRGKQSLETLADRVRELQNRLAQVEHAYATAQVEVLRLTQALAAAQAQAATWQTEVLRLQEQWTVARDRLIVVLKVSGRLHGAQYRRSAGVRAGGSRLGRVCARGYHPSRCQRSSLAGNGCGRPLPLSGAISMDEVFLKELGRKVLGVVIVDPLSGLILRLERCGERSGDGHRQSDPGLR